MEKNILTAIPGLRAIGCGSGGALILGNNRFCRRAWRWWPQVAVLAGRRRVRGLG